MEPLTMARTFDRIMTMTNSGRILSKGEKILLKDGGTSAVKKKAVAVKPEAAANNESGEPKKEGPANDMGLNESLPKL